MKNGAVENNTCNNNYWDGIYLYLSSNNTISNNNCNNKWDGIWLWSSSNNTISNNNCNNKWDGIWLWSSSSNTISNNNCNNNYWDGIYLLSSSSNTISSNILVNNSNYGYGIYIDSDSSYNYIYKNAFFYNHGSGDRYAPSYIQAYDAGSNNYWNSTAGVGNYWRGWANNNDTNAHNGIVDWPYKIAGSAGAEDYYPLKNATCPMPMLPLMPTAPQNLHTKSGNGYVNLTWEKPLGEGSSPITGYKIYRNESLLTTVPANQLYYNDTNVVGGQRYIYYVTAINSVGESEESNVVVATPRSAVPELQAFWLPIIALLLLLGVLRRRDKTRN